MKIVSILSCLSYVLALTTMGMAEPDNGSTEGPSTHRRDPDGEQGREGLLRGRRNLGFLDDKESIKQCNGKCNSGHVKLRNCCYDCVLDKWLCYERRRSDDDRNMCEWATNEVKCARCEKEGDTECCDKCYSTDHHINVYSDSNTQGTCFKREDWLRDSNDNWMREATCAQTSGSKGTIRNKSNKKCLYAPAGKSRIKSVDCDGGDDQNWVYDDSNEQLRSNPDSQQRDGTCLGFDGSGFAKVIDSCDGNNDDAKWYLDGEQIKNRGKGSSYCLRRTDDNHYRLVDDCGGDGERKRFIIRVDFGMGTSG